MPSFLESLLEEFEFRIRALQQLLENLDATPLVRALGLKQRIFARPLAARPLHHQSGCEARSVFLNTRSGLFQKPCLHAVEGPRGRHHCLKWLRGLFLDQSSMRLGRTLARNHSPDPVQILLLRQLRPIAKNSVVFLKAHSLLLEELDATPLVSERSASSSASSARPLAQRVVGLLGHQSGRKAGSVLAHPRSGLFQKPCLHAAEGHRGRHFLNSCGSRINRKHRSDKSFLFDLGLPLLELPRRGCRRSGRLPGPHALLHIA